MKLNRYLMLLAMIIGSLANAPAQVDVSVISPKQDRGSGIQIEALLVAQPYSAGAGIGFTKEIGNLKATVSISSQFVPYHKSLFCYTYNPNTSDPARLTMNAGPRQPVIGYEGTASIRNSYSIAAGLRKHFGISGWYMAISPEYHLLNWKGKSEDEPVEYSNLFFGNCGEEFSISVLPWEGQLETVNVTAVNAEENGQQHFIGLSLGVGYSVISGNNVFDRFSFELGAVYLRALQTDEFAPRPDVHDGREIIGALVPKDVRYGLQLKVGYRLIGGF